MKHFCKSSKGSVMLEFVIVLPLYLLLFGGTFLTFENSLARIHLLESNRNLAWLAEDRYNVDNRIQKRLLKEVRRYYDNRNAIENRIAITAGDLYGFGDQEGSWGTRIAAFKDGGGAAEVSIEVDPDHGASNILTKWLPQNRWCSLYSGNMELKMKHISAAYIGAIATSDIFHGNDDPTRKFYKANYDLTRADGSNGESLLIHRKGSSKERESINSASLALTRLTLEGWPIGKGLLNAFLTDQLVKISDKITSKISDALQ